MHPTACFLAPRVPLARTRPAAACRLSRGRATSSRSRLRMQSSFSCGCSSRYSETRRSWCRCAKGWKRQARCSALRQPSEPRAHTALCVLLRSQFAHAHTLIYIYLASKLSRERPSTAHPATGRACRLCPQSQSISVASASGHHGSRITRHQKSACEVCLMRMPPHSTQPWLW